MLYSDAIADFMLEQRVRGNSPKTLLYYQHSLDLFSEFLGSDIEMEEITVKRLKQYYIFLQERGTLCSVSIQSRIRALRAFLAFCYTEGYISTNLTERFKLPRAKRPAIDVLTDEEVDRILSSFNCKRDYQLRNYCICSLMLDSGLRLNEVVTLTVDHLHLAEGYCIVEGKGNKERTVPFGFGTRQHLTHYMRRRPACARSNRVFLKTNMEPITENSVKQIFKKLKKQLDMPRLHPHLLRHTFATRYLENGGDMYSLQQILGHTSLEMVKRYVHLTRRNTLERYPNFSPLDNLRAQ